MKNKQLLHILSVGVCLALSVQHTERLGCIMLSSVTFPSVRHFSTLSHRRRGFRESY